MIAARVLFLVLGLVAQTDKPGQSAGSGDTVPKNGLFEVNDPSIQPPVFTRKVTPKYPRSALKTKMAATVTMEVVLRKNGKMTDFKVIQGVGDGTLGFEEETKKALLRWRFKPATAAGKPVDVRMVLKIDFHVR